MSNRNCAVCNEAVCLLTRLAKNPPYKTKDLRDIPKKVMECITCCPCKTIGEFADKYVPLLQNLLDRQVEVHGHPDESDYSSDVRPRIANLIKKLRECKDHYDFIRNMKTTLWTDYSKQREALNKLSKKYGFEPQKTRTELEEKATKDAEIISELKKEVELLKTHLLTQAERMNEVKSERDQLKNQCFENGRALDNLISHSNDIGEKYGVAMNKAASVENQYNTLVGKLSDILKENI